MGDRNYGRRRALQAFRRHSGEQADFIIRLRWRSLTLCRPDGSAFNLFDHLRGLPVDGAPHEVLVHATGADEAHEPPLPVRLIILRKPPEAAERERQRLRRMAHASKPGSIHAAWRRRNSSSWRPRWISIMPPQTSSRCIV